jgi:hypothetical protein
MNRAVVGILISFSLMSGVVAQVPATTTASIDQYIESKGGCSFFETSLIREFNRRDKKPYEKAHVDWTPDDYQTLRNWEERCLTPFSRAPGRREFLLKNLEHRISNYMREQHDLIKLRAHQESVAANARRKQEKIVALSAKVDHELQAITGSVSSTVTRATDFVASTKQVDFEKLDATVQNGLQVQAEITKAESALRSIDADLRRLRDMGGSQSHPTFDRAAFVAFKTRLTYLSRLATLRKACEGDIKRSDIPASLMHTRIFAMSQDDPFLFQLLCPPILRGAKVTYRGSTSSHDITVNRLRLTFFQKDSGQVPSGSPSSSGPSADTRLILRRINSGDSSEEVTELWQSVNLLNLTAALLSAMGP